MVVLMSADRRPLRASDDEIAAWAEVRPAPACRTPEDVAAARSAVERLRASGDRRLRFLAQGVESALDWVTGASEWAPVLDVRRPRPNLRELAEVLSEAGQVAAGRVALPGKRMSDAGRITDGECEDGAGLGHGRAPAGWVLRQDRRYLGRPHAALRSRSS